MSKKQKKMLTRILIASALMILLNVLKLPKPVSAGLYLVTYLVIGYDILQKAWRGILNKRPLDRKSTRLNSSHPTTSRMPSSA